MLSRREIINWTKAVLGFVLAVTFVFGTGGFSSFIQSRACYWAMYINVTHSPSKTVGAYMNQTLLILMMVAAGAVMWCILQGLCGSSDIAMAVVLYVWVYCVSLLRSTSHERYYTVCMVGVLIAYISTAGETGVLGPNSSHGSQLDYIYLRDTVNSFLVGMLIGLCVNVLVFPDFAESHLIDKLDAVFSKMSALSRASIDCVLTSDYSKEAYMANCATRNRLVSEIQTAFGQIDVAIDQASMEITYSHYSMKDYSRISRQITSVAAVMFSMNTVLNSPETLHLLMSPEYQTNVGPAMRDVWKSFDDADTAIWVALSRNLKESMHHEKGNSNKLIVALDTTAREAFDAFSVHMPAVFTTVFDHTEDGVLSSSTDSWERFVQVNFYLLGMKEYLQELVFLHEISESRCGDDHPVRFHLNWLIPVRDFFRRTKARFVKGFQKPSPNWKSEFLVSCKNHFLSDASIYAVKSATAILCFQLILFLDPETYENWFFERCLAPIAVALSPNLGQTYGTLLPRIMGTVVGASLAYGSVVLFGVKSAWHVLTAVIAAVPCFYIALFHKKHLSLANLTLISFANYLFISLAFLGDPTFPAPQVYLYRLVSVVSVALCFALFFTSVIYPQFARRRLRDRMSDIFRDLNVFYRKIVSNSLRTRDLELEFTDTKDLRNKIFKHLVALEPLLQFSIQEPRIEGKFQIQEYRKVVECMYHLLDRLECLRLCVGDQPFNPKINEVLRFGEYGEGRAEMHQTIRILLYIFTSTMLTKIRILPNLPNASQARDRMIHGFVTMLVEHNRPHSLNGSDPFDTVLPSDQQGMLTALITDKWVRVLGMSVSLREVSRVLDETGPHMKAIFGEAPDIVDPEKEVLKAVVIKE
ncbi:hypothetical protein HDU98_008649 [Podochytrium sp. JEL0797]|nr:hypothetical protein HDU98_008649 [Podochytrium sp. JEL0797]